jgi:hypothetical protein
MRSRVLVRSILAASVAAAVPFGSAAAEPLAAAELASLIGSQGFEFRGRQTMWKFSPDGKVQADDNNSRATQGAMGETWGIKNSGTWRRDGEKLCIAWQDARAEQCYTVSRAAGRMVVLSGPRIIDGTIDARGATGNAGTPAAQPAPVPPGIRYQRVPGPR